jgi:hypothetical protein
MKFIFFASFITVLIIISCSGSPKRGKPLQNKIEKNKPGSSFTDTLKIDFPVAVFYSPDSVQLEKIKSITDPRTFEGRMHEDFYLFKNARAVIGKYYPGLKIIDAKNVRYLLFLKADKSADYVDLDAKADAYGLYICDGDKAPLLTDMANVDTDLEFYFSRKKPISH